MRWEHPAAVADFDQALTLYQTRGAAGRVLPAAHPPRRCSLSCRRQRPLPGGYRRAFRLDARQTCQLIIERLAADIRANLNLVLANCDKHLQNPSDDIAHARRALVWLLMGRDADADRDFEDCYRKRTRSLGLLELLIPAGHIARNTASLSPAKGSARLGPAKSLRSAQSATLACFS